MPILKQPLKSLARRRVAAETTGVQCAAKVWGPLAGQASGPPLRIGIVGTGFVARGFFELVHRNYPFIEIVKVFSRRPTTESPWIGEGLHTSALEAVADAADIILEVSGDVVLATQACQLMLERDKPVVTLNAEFHVTNGSYFADRMFLTEAHGDQPGNAAALHAEALLMGFEPLAHVNYKGFLNHNPNSKDMAYWAARQGLSVPQTVSFTDGSKIQIEQAVTANGLGLEIAREGLIGGERAGGFDLDAYGDAAVSLGKPIADFAQARGAPPGIALVAHHPRAEGKMGYTAFSKIATPSQNYLVLQTGYHLVHLEIPRIFHSLWSKPRADWQPLLNNGAQPRFGVAAVAKRPLVPGELIERGLGGFEVRGVAVRIADRPDHVPICLLRDARVRRRVAAGNMLTLDDVELPVNAATEVYARLHPDTAALVA